MTTQTIHDSRKLRFILDGEPVDAKAGESILQAAQRLKVEIPYLCYHERLRADGNCRSCMVEVKGERVLQGACVRKVSSGMEVVTKSDRVRNAQRMVLELLQSDMPKESTTPPNDLDNWCHRLQVPEDRFSCREQPKKDFSHPGIHVQLDSCIQCTRCVRACREAQNNDVIGYARRGSQAEIVFDFADTMGSSTCVGCGECVQVCPTGALAPASASLFQKMDKKVSTVCPYCGVGCLLEYGIRDGKIAHSSGRDGPSNQGRLCIKGRFGYDYIYHSGRLTKPLVRRSGKSKFPDVEKLSEENIGEWFREATWDEALELAAEGFLQTLEEKGSAALAGLGCAKGSNEEAYLFQKLVRTGFRNNNVDHCTRLCHASSVAALLEGLGSAAVSNQVADVSNAEVILVIGANPTGNHPVAATFIQNAVRSGKTLIVMDPRGNDLVRDADFFLQFRPDTDVALLNGIMAAIVEQGLVNEEFIQKRTTGFAEFEKNLKNYSPEKASRICGISPEILRKVAKCYATSKAAMIFWGMGISQHVHGTDNARCLIAMSLMTGQIGRPGTGLHPLRGQNNVQGASDVGLIPMAFPDYQRVDAPQARRHFEQVWGCDLDENPGLTVVEIVAKAVAGEIESMYIMGENPAMSDPNLHHARRALSSLKHLVVQDIFMTETAWFADVIFPASALPEKTGTFTNTDRRVQLGRQAVSPPGDARQDLWIIQEMARRIGLLWKYEGPQSVFEEMRRVMSSIAGITWERLEKSGSVTYPCKKEGDPGQATLFVDSFPTENGRGRFVPASFSTANELPDEQYPLVFITGRLLEHWHTGAMTRRASVLNAVAPTPTVAMHPDDLEKCGASEGDELRVASRRGTIFCAAVADHNLQTGEVFMPFCFREAAANLLTNDALDPFGKIPEFKFCAVRVESANRQS